MKRTYFALLLFTGMCVSSCLNSRERELVGYYEIQVSELPGTLQSQLYDIPTLTLKKDRTFVLAFRNRTKAGEWKAFDADDWTLIEFTMDGNNIQGTVGIDQISINNPYQFDCPFLKTREMVFKRIKK